MIADWFAIYLVAKGFDLEQTAAGFWVPFLASDLGNFFGGGVSSALIRRGWPVGRARKVVIVGGGFGVLALACRRRSRRASRCCSRASRWRPSRTRRCRRWRSRCRPTSSTAARWARSPGWRGRGAGLGTIASTFLIGVIADRFSFTPILLVSSVVPLVAAAVVLLLVRNTAASGRGSSR